MHVLDNPVWHALTGPQQKVADARSAAARYDPDVAPFAAVPDAPTAGSWDDLRELVGHGGAAVLVRPLAVPDGWAELFRLPCAQMVATTVEPAHAADASVLGPSDVEDMLALVGRTHPGPFERRTIELGDYLGIRDDTGTLVAMAGVRMQLPGYTEISAVCTDEGARGRGLASALVRDLVGRILDRGATPMLHVVTTNAGAIRLYGQLGFTLRREQDVIGLRPPE